MSQQNTERRLAEFVDTCRRQGIKATHQRMEIFRELLGTPDHPDAEAVYKHVRKRIPSISLDTVYRTLNFLEEKGLIDRVGSMRASTRFDANMDRHHHFVCVECGLIGDFVSEQFDQAPVPREVAAMGCVDRVYVELRGTCRKCQANSRNGTK